MDLRVINAIAWAVPPGAKLNTRPFLLTQELVRLGVIDQEFSSLFHGRHESKGHHTNAGKWWPGRRLNESGDNRAVLSPVFFSQDLGQSKWIDFYDDWSIAPDINVWHRYLSSLSYKAISAANGINGGVTCNSPYMAAKLKLPNSSIVPNGVAEEQGTIPTSGTSARRLLMLGHFFQGRTDFKLIDELCRQDYFDEFVIGAPGTDPRMLALLEDLRRRLGRALSIHDWLSTEELAALAGPETAALVPHLVNDYTLSQDLMKVYSLSALGIRIICPRLLWPHSLTKEFAYLLDYGVRPEDTLSNWFARRGPDSEWRRNFGVENSWQSRARRIARLIEVSE